ncbi:MAG: DNA polymerase III subunit alpha [Candidatus Kerfeldbacteria bacterium]|nr:DNA polymerase III subunit alpha [Candidatus Kerfeldbacteria bacterium]
MAKPFVHLHVHSHYSLLDGLPKVDALVSFAAEQGATALALTDHGALYGAIEFYQLATKAGIKPIIGVETYIAPLGLKNKRAKVDERNHHLVLLAETNVGYQNLLKLVTVAHLEGYYYRPRVDHDLLRAHRQGLIALSGCLKGEIPSAILNDDVAGAEKLIRLYQDIFGPQNFFLELQHHPSMPQQATVNAALITLSKKTGAPLVATADSHYLRPEDQEAQDILLCIHKKKQLADKDRMSMAGDDLSLKSPELMWELFGDTPEALENTVKIAERCQVEIALGQTQLPHYEVPAGKTPMDYLRELAERGIPGRYGQVTPAISERLEYELGVIAKTGFASYFLIVQDFVNWAKQHGIVVGPGRGSAAGSIVSYLLNITNVDPLKYDLLFERFLNPERIAMPDIDIDFADIRRDEVLRYVEGKYGHDHVSQIITFGTMAARAAIRDVGRVLGLPYAYCDRVAKLIPMFNTLDVAIADVPELKDIYENDPEAKRLLDSAKKLEGVARHASRHACGVVITKEPLDRYVPVQYAGPDDDSIIAQYSLHPIEDLGLLKMDFLGLSNLTILETCVNLLHHTRRIEIDLDRIPLDDKKTFRLLQRGETTGVFQLESGGIRRYLRDLKPTSLEDIIAMVALYRPGPMELIPQFIDGKHGKIKPTYLDPRLEPILNKTYGVAVYQEQVMQMARDIAGFSLGEADVLRKAVGKKIAKLLKEQREKFIEGAVKNGMKRPVAEKIFDFIEPFARYGFNRSHAACYAVIAYQTAYCKANYPAEFMAALLTSDQHNTDRIAIEIDDARRMGLQVLAPDINESFASFTVVNDEAGQPTRIRFGLSAIKNVGEHLVEAIIKERKAKGSFASLDDFFRRVQHKDLNKKSLESLAKVGALDAFAERQAIIDNLNDLLKYTRLADQEAERRQSSLFAHLPAQHAPTLRLKPATPAPKSQRGLWEKELLGLYISDHPLNEHRHFLNRTTQSIQAAREQKARQVKIGGLITTVKRITTRTNETMAFARVEDLSGTVEIVIFPSVYRDTQDFWVAERLVVIEGKSSSKDGEWKLLADKVWDLPQLIAAQPTRAAIQIAIALETATPALFTSVKELLQAHPGDQTVELLVTRGTQKKTVPTSQKIALTEELRSALQKLLGNCIVE